MNFVMTHARGARSIAAPVDQQSSTLLLYHKCPSCSLFYCSKYVLSDKVPVFISGIGHAMAKTLSSLDVLSVADLAERSVEELSRSLDHHTAERLHQLAHGVDRTAVTPTGKPQVRYNIWCYVMIGVLGHNSAL